MYASLNFAVYDCVGQLPGFTMETVQLCHSCYKLMYLNCSVFYNLWHV